MTDIEITEYAFTFGVQYRRPSEFNHPEETHPRGMHGYGYAVIEAPDADTARAIAHAIFGDKWSFQYTLAEMLEESRREMFYPDGEILRIAWQTPEQKRAILAQMESIVEGHPATAEPQSAEFVPPDMPASLYNALMTYLISRTGGDTRALILADQVKNLYGASVRRRAERTHAELVNTVILRDERDPLYETAQGERTEFAKGQDRYRADHEAAVNAPKDSLGNPVAEHMNSVRDRFAEIGSPRAIADKAEAEEIQKRADS
ncbi:hypothetical protein SEA_RASPUTIA_121 [Microbacterium phage Rasputia]|nr:hypothetical protein SEA_RASPUTIA_121 [Microbacterium phage Rasputia]